MSWIQEVMDATEKVETPRHFVFWGALATIAGVVKNNVWIDKDGVYNLYPNVYVLLVAPSGHRKGFPPALATALLAEVGGLRTITGRSSIEGIIADLANAKTSPGGGAPITDASGIILSGEFSTSLVRNPDALTILTDLYDSIYHKEWKNTLKHSGVESLKNVCLSLLGGLNQTHFDDMITEKEISGGFIARCLIVEANKRSKKNPLVRKTGTRLNIKELANYLKSLRNLKGEFEWTEEALQCFEEWYMSYDPESKNDRTGSAMRVHDQILKVAMLLSLGRRPMLLLEREDIEGAMRLCLETTSLKPTQGAGISEYAKKTRILLAALETAPKFMLSRAQILSKFYGDFDANDLTRIQETLVQAEYIYEPYVKELGGKRDMVYELTPHIVKQLKDGAS